MNDKKNNQPQPDNDEKLDIKKSIFQVNKELQKQREAEQEAMQAEIERKHAQREKEKREAYEKKLQDEKIELMRMKQGLIEESETIHEEKEEEIQLTFWKKIGNFFYHNKWWLGLAVFFVALGSYLTYDLLTKPRPDMVILMLCDNATVGNSAYLESYFTDFGEDSNKNGKTEVAVYYIPYSDDEYTNYQNGVTTKLTNYLNSDDAVMVIGNEKTVTDLLIPDDSLVDLSTMFPDNPKVDKYFFYLKDTDFAEKIGVPKNCITDDMFFALRKPQDLRNASAKEIQKTYDKDIATFKRIINDLS
ncbi:MULTISPECIES: hypothetical protein [Ruminococcus]|uniref:Uncharacterized protein n=1 Tax=Ruminococcus flavefaciens TaxID=1265 RepID=A0A1M7IJT8_RUMFL|nr:MULTISPECIES: hypothetical protein [Ruminococcus]MCR4795025.1 hypothetical protein [Ruminococcus sp.]SHM40939.1 hypothetical protein SAMN04487860_104161 [Ruminococcus flavefaciens]